MSNLSLLPNLPEEFQSEGYWNSFFKKRKQLPFEWYGNYDDLKELIDKYMKIPDKTLHVGCGNSSLPETLYDVGYKSVENIDVSKTVINQMMKRNRTKRPNLVFKEMDANNMSYENESFKVVLDKGTADAILSGGVDLKVPDDSLFDTEIQDNPKMFAEIDRVLMPGGRFLCVTLAQQNVIRRILSHFLLKKNYLIRIHRVQVMKTFLMPTFLLVFMKMKAELPKQSFEVNFYDSMFKCPSLTDFLSQIESFQNLHYISQKVGSMKTSESSSLHIDMVDNGLTRYRCYIVDNPSVKDKNYAVFLCPFGGENHWMFKLAKGRKTLVVDEIKVYHRVLIVLLNPTATYEDSKLIEKELNSRVMAFAPEGYDGSKVPYLSLAEEDFNPGFGAKLIQEYNSDISGAVAIYEYEADDEQNKGKKLFRKLIFKNYPFMCQTEVEVDHMSKEVNVKSLSFEIHYIMALVATNVILKLNISSHKFHMGLIGLGGGSLAKFFHAIGVKCRVTCFELDPVVLQIAKEHFGFEENEDLSCEIKDGVQAIADVASNPESDKCDAVLIDVNAGSDEEATEMGITAPPMEFLSKEFLSNASKAVQTTGFVLMNFGCLDAASTRRVLTSCRAIFTHVGIVKLADVANHLLILSKNSIQNLDIFGCSVAAVFDAKKVEGMIESVKF